MSGNGHGSGLRRVVELAVASSLPHLTPTVTFEYSNHLTNFHNTQRLPQHHVWWQEPVVCGSQRLSM